MELDPLSLQKQAAAAFWKAYFAKFRRRVEDHEPSQTQGASLSAEVSPTDPVSALPFPDRRRPRTWSHRFTLPR